MFSRKSYTLNFDGSCNDQANKSSAGCIIRDNKGDLVVAASYNLTKTNLPYYNLEIAEAVGLWNGLKLAKKHSLNLTLIMGDSKKVLELVFDLTRRHPGPPLYDIIVDIKGMINQGLPRVKLITQGDNEVAYELAYLGHLLKTRFKVFTRYNYYSLPSKVTEQIRREKVYRGINVDNDDDDNNDLIMALAGIGLGILLAWGVSEYFPGDASSNYPHQPKLPKLRSTAVEAQKSWDSDTNIDPADASTLLRKYIGNTSYYVLQYFGSDRNQLQKARAGCILTNRGDFFEAGAFNLDHKFPDCNVAIAEAIALCNGLKMAYKYGALRVDLIQGRNVEVRNRVLGFEKRAPRFQLLTKLINEIKYFLELLPINQYLESRWQLVDEDSIAVARALAIEGGLLEDECMIYEDGHDLPPRVADLIYG